MKKSSQQKKQVARSATQKKAVTNMKEMSKELSRQTAYALHEVHDLLSGQPSMDRTQKCLAMIMDPRGNNSVPLPAPSSAFVNQVALFRLKSNASVTINASGVGIALLGAPTSRGFSDRVCMMTTNGSWVATASSTLPTALVTGVTAQSWGNAPFLAAGSYPLDSLSRVEASCAYVRPSSVFTARGGSGYFLDPSSGYLNAGVTLAQIQADPRARRIDLVDSNEDNVYACYSQPRAMMIAQNQDGNIGAEFTASADFCYVGAASTSFAVNATVSAAIAFFGPPNSVIDIDYYAVYAFAGRKVNAGRICETDPIAWAALTNTLSANAISGYAGPPNAISHVASSAILEHGGSIVKQVIGQAEKYLPKLETGAKHLLSSLAGFS